MIVIFKLFWDSIIGCLLSYDHSQLSIFVAFGNMTALGTSNKEGLVTMNGKENGSIVGVDMTYAGREGVILARGGRA